MGSNPGFLAIRHLPHPTAASYLRVLKIILAKVKSRILLNGCTFELLGCLLSVSVVSSPDHLMSTCAMLIHSLTLSS